MHASLGISETPSDYDAIFDYLDELDGNKDKKIEKANFNSFVDKITVAGQPAETVNNYKKEAKKRFGSEQD